MRTSSPPTSPSPANVASEIPRSLIEQRDTRRAQQRDAVAREFEAIARRAGLSGYEWRALEDTSIAGAAMHARYADLAIIGQTDSNDAASVAANGLPELLALASGRPVLVIPYIGARDPIGQRVLVGWNASREAARAVTDALPILREAKQVTVVAVNAADSRRHGEIPGADIGLFLARHGVKATVASSERVEFGAGEWLLSRAADLQADLIVAGAYGQSRLREMVLGGVTQTLLANMTVPVLFSH
jgi:nucleotide-binding universal stress UspA family protein